jgi:hypothetical protein
MLLPMREGANWTPAVKTDFQQARTHCTVLRKDQMTLLRETLDQPFRRHERSGQEGTSETTRTVVMDPSLPF